jgi:hypothetical protein
MTRIFWNFLSLWHALKDAIQNTIDKRVPSKMTQGRNTHPWINTTIRRKINWKQKAHKKARKTKKKRDVDRCFEMRFQMILDLLLSCKYLLFSIDIFCVSLVLA